MACRTLTLVTSKQLMSTLTLFCVEFIAYWSDTSLISTIRVNLESLAFLQQKSFLLHLTKHDSLDTTIKNMNAP